MATPSREAQATNLTLFAASVIAPEIYLNVQSCGAIIFLDPMGVLRAW